MKLSKIYLSLFLTFPLTALAVEENWQENNTLQEISVVALRDPSQFAQTAHTYQMLKQQALAQQQARSVADALKYLTNVDVQGGARTIVQKPIIRGLSGNRVVQVIDGVRQNFDLAHRGSYFLPMSAIQEIEVIKGPSSALWGSGALGGVVAMRTSDALDLLKNGESLGAKIHQGYQSANALSETDLSVFGANRQFDWLVQGFYNDANALRLGSGSELPHSGYQQTGGRLKLGWQIDDAQRVEFSHRFSQFEQTSPANNEAVGELTNDDIRQLIGDWHRSNPTADLSQMLAFYAGLESSLGNVSYLSDQKIKDQSSVVNYLLNPTANPYLNAQFTLYNNQTTEQETRVKSGLADQTKLKTTGFNACNTSAFNGISLTYGVDYYQDKATTQRGTNDTDGAYRADPYQAKSKVTGAYLLAHLPLGGRVVLSPSLRYDQFKTGGESTRYSDHHWSPAVALTIKAAQWLDLTAKYNEAFRAPSLQERFTRGAHFGISSAGRSLVNTFVANPALKPETAKNKEIGAHLHVDNLFRAEDKFSLKALYFQNDVKDFINLTVFKANPANPYEFLPQRSQYQNVTNAQLRGVEVEAAYQLAAFNVGLSYAQTRGKDKTTHQPLANIAADKLSAQLDYALVKDKFNIGTRVTRYAAQQHVPQGNTQTYKGYTLADIYAAYAPLKGEWANLRLDFAIENLFDKAYQPAFSLMEGAGRNVKASVAYTF